MNCTNCKSETEKVKTCYSCGLEICPSCGYDICLNCEIKLYEEVGHVNNNKL